MRTPIRTNKVFKHLQQSSKKITVEQGGTRSGKTYNVLMWIIFSYCAEPRGKTITVARKTFPAVRSTVMRDFFDILKQYDLYDVEAHNKSSNEYILNGNMVEFVSLDQPQKIRGRKRDLAFLNEANELDFEDWQQIAFRTSEKIILDYNPSDTFHWIYDKVIPRDDAEFYQTTYLDNPFLPSEIKLEIERLKQTDEQYWRIYGLGERGTNRSQIFQYNVFKELPKEAKLIGKGLDFGFTNDPTSLVEVYRKDIELYIIEKLYHTGLTNQDIAHRLDIFEYNRREPIYADSAEPKSIEELYRMGYNVKPVSKGRDSVIAGIDVLKRYKLFIQGSNLEKEFQNYRWEEDKNGNLLNKPIDKYNHAIDATRYAVYSTLSNQSFGSYTIR